MSLFLGADSIEIRDVWAANLVAEFDLIGDIVAHYPYVAMDTEFPGFLVQHNNADDPDNPDSHYDILRENVDQLKLIQVGLTFFNDAADLPTCGTGRHIVWQFNFREFNILTDPHSPQSIQLLVSSGIDLARNMKEGVDAEKFAELLMSSGAVMSDQVRWITFQGGYDFAYLLKNLSGNPMPETREEFFNKVRVYFPIFYDARHMINFVNGLFGGLETVGASLGVARVGSAHQGGSDSLLTAGAFVRLREGNRLPQPWESYAGVLHMFGPFQN